MSNKDVVGEVLAIRLRYTMEELVGRCDDIDEIGNMTIQNPVTLGRTQGNSLTFVPWGILVSHRQFKIRADDILYAGVVPESMSKAWRQFDSGLVLPNGGALLEAPPSNGNNVMPLRKGA